ncbi:hypothetical protein A8F94_09935 [Bacillus sp. FJAT-27225]|uniref:DUF2877 domain-containing protein n=1 Tax=Bacillus sp. FJAT-27225 TaxID=1743144 RepID=UPI00080C2E07|nr:DUF2877 domain-containing protein [Bacillus sp. FJAT-27225]OCA88355.1 hypothetical protein A8F94_09935 [Bacillus sp. FJAT-27225]
MNRVIAGEENFLLAISTGFTGTVHSVFDRTINILRQEDGELYTLAAPTVDLAPNTLIVDYTKSFKELQVRIQDSVYSENNRLLIRNKLYKADWETESWKCTMPPYPKDPRQLEQNIEIVKDSLSLFGKKGGIKPVGSYGNMFENETSRLLEERIKSLLENLELGREAAAIEKARGLVGLGPGLTPSGDDFLVGLFAAFHFVDSPASNYRGFAERVAGIAKPLTNEISYMAIKKASVGEVRESIVQLAMSVIGGSQKEVVERLKAVLSIGSTSGTDIAFGMLAGLELIIKVGGKTWL